jgi:hypothetical protein
MQVVGSLMLLLSGVQWRVWPEQKHCYKQVLAVPKREDHRQTFKQHWTV